MLKELKILEKHYELILWMFPLITKFPQKQRFVLGQQMENSLLGILENIIQSNHEQDKKNILKADQEEGPSGDWFISWYMKETAEAEKPFLNITYTPDVVPSQFVPSQNQIIL